MYLSPLKSPQTFSNSVLFFLFPRRKRKTENRHRVSNISGVCSSLSIPPSSLVQRLIIHRKLKIVRRKLESTNEKQCGCLVYQPTKKYQTSHIREEIVKNVQDRTYVGKAKHKSTTVLSVWTRLGVYVCVCVFVCACLSDMCLTQHPGAAKAPYPNPYRAHIQKHAPNS